MEATTDLVARLYERWNARDLTRLQRKRLTISLQEVSDTGGRVLALWVFDGEGRDGVQVRREGAHLVTLSDGLAQRIEVYGTWDAARAAAQEGRST